MFKTFHLSIFKKKIVHLTRTYPINLERGCIYSISEAKKLDEKIGGGSGIIIIRKDYH
jgi:hypothetical protein